MSELQQEELCLKRALEHYEAEYLAELPGQAALEPIRFSPSFERRMQKMIAGQKRKSRGRILFQNGIGRRAACVLLAFLALPLGVFGVKAAADPSFRFTVYETFSTLVFPSAQTHESEYREPAFLPEGFEQTRQVHSPAGFYTVYRNASGDYFSIEQSTLDNAVHNLDTENAQTEEVSVGGYGGIFIQKDSGNILVWNDTRNTFLMTGNLSQGDMMKIAGSMSGP